MPEYTPLTADSSNDTRERELQARELEDIDLDQLAEEIYRLMVCELRQERERGA